MMDRERRQWDEAEARRAGARRGRFVDEIYTEDEDEATDLADGEARRSARMLGCAILFALACFLLGSFAAIVWPS